MPSLSVTYNPVACSTHPHSVTRHHTLRHATSGLLSARVLLPIVLGNGSDVAHMSQALLQLAADLASRLLPAFNTVTGIPYGEINLRIT